MIFAILRQKQFGTLRLSVLACLRRDPRVQFRAGGMVRGVSVIAAGFAALAVTSFGDYDQLHNDPQILGLAPGEIAQKSGAIESAQPTASVPSDCVEIIDKKSAIATLMRPYRNGPRMSLPREPGEWLKTDLRARVMEAASRRGIRGLDSSTGENDLDSSGKNLPCEVWVEVELRADAEHADLYMVYVRIEDAKRYSSTAFLGRIDPGPDLDGRTQRDLFDTFGKALEAGFDAQRKTGEF